MMSFLRTRRSADRTLMADQGLIHGQCAFPASFTLVVAVVLLLIGVVAIISIVFDIGPF